MSYMRGCPFEVGVDPDVPPVLPPPVGEVPLPEAEVPPVGLEVLAEVDIVCAM